MTFKSKTRIAAAIALTLAAAGANAAIDNANTNFGNSSALFVAMDSGASGAPTISMAIDLGVSMGDFVKAIGGVKLLDGALSFNDTIASWNFGTNTRTVNGVAVAGDYAWSSIASSFFANAVGDVRWGVVGADTLSGAVSGTNTIANRNILTTGSPEQSNITGATGINNAAQVSTGATNFQTFTTGQFNQGTQGSSANGASIATSGGGFLNTVMKGTFGGAITWDYLSAVDTSSNLFLINQQQNPVVYQLGETYGVDTLLTEGAASFRYDSTTNLLSFASNPITTPVPEPETYAMLFAGLAVIGAAVRRRNRRG